MYTYAPCVHLVPTDIRNVSDSLEIELEMVVSNHAGAEKNEPRFSRAMQQILLTTD